MTGKTHMAISAATVAVVLSAAGTRASNGIPNLLPVGAGTPYSGAPTIIGLLLLGMVAGLFPDLDAPDTELLHLPHRAARRVGRYIKMGMPRGSAWGTLAQELVSLATLPVSLLVAGIGAALRAFTGHRGFTHTLWGALAFTTLTAAAAFTITGSIQGALPVATVWLLGYASHLATDACTPSGIPLLGGRGNAQASHRRSQPYTLSVPASYRPARVGHVARVREFHLLPERMRIRTGTATDTLLVRWVSWAVFLVAATPMLVG